MKNIRNQLGFGLIEGLIAAVIFTLAMVALIQLQGVLFKSSSSAQARSSAMTLAEEKIEDLRSFQVYQDTNIGVFDFVAIGTNAGGICTNQVPTSPCEPILPSTAGSKTINVGNINYSRDWTVTDYYYDAAGLLTTPVPASAQIDHKLVEVSISWTDTDGTDQVLALQNVINVNSGASGGVLAASQGGSGGEIYVPHNELAAPDVLPTKVKLPPPREYTGSDDDWDNLSDSEQISEYQQLGRCNVQTFGSTETPDPILEANSTLDNRIVSFTSTIYQTYTPCDPITGDPLADPTTTKIKLKDDEFKTINCRCALAAAGLGKDQSNTVVSKIRTGIPPSNQQDPLCTTCCRDHHENQSGGFLCGSGANPESCYDPYRSSSEYNAAGNHKHFRFENNNFIEATLNGDLYDEVCRIKRVDGFFNVVQDWKLIAHNVFNELDYESDAEIESYSNYVGTTVNSYLTNPAQTLPLNSWDSPNKTKPVNGRQMVSRSIYVDYLTPAQRSQINKSGSSVEFNVPYYELKTTLLSNWQTANISTVGSDVNINTSPVTLCEPNNSINGTCVDSRPIDALANKGANQTITKGTYRTITGIEGGNDINILNSMRDSNSGVVSVNPIDPTDTSLTLQRFFVDYNGGRASPSNRKLTIAQNPNFTCPTSWQNPQDNRTSGPNAPQWSNITLSCNPGSLFNGTCQGYTVDRVVTATATLNTASLSCTYANSGVKSCPSSFATSNILVNGDKNCAVQMSRSGQNTACNLVCN